MVSTDEVERAEVERAEVVVVEGTFYRNSKLLHHSSGLCTGVIKIGHVIHVLRRKRAKLLKRVHDLYVMHTFIL